MILSLTICQLAVPGGSCETIAKLRATYGDMNAMCDIGDKYTYPAVAIVVGIITGSELRDGGLYN